MPCSAPASLEPTYEGLKQEAPWERESGTTSLEPTYEGLKR